MANVPSEPPRALSQSWRWVAGGLLAIAIVLVADLVVDDTVLMGALIVGPFVAALGARPAQVAGLGVLAVGLAVALGETNDIFGTRDHVVRVVIVLAGCVAAYLLARVRVAREDELERTKPAALESSLELNPAQLQRLPELLELKQLSCGGESRVLVTASSASNHASSAVSSLASPRTGRTQEKSCGLPSY